MSTSLCDDEVTSGVRGVHARAREAEGATAARRHRGKLLASAANESAGDVSAVPARDRTDWSCPMPEYTRTCLVCGSPFRASRSHANYCSRACRNVNARQWGAENYQRITYSAKLPTGTVGALSEMLVGADLMSRGYHVFRALSPSCPCDLIALLDDTSIRVEVRTGWINTSGEASCPVASKDVGRADVLAIMLPNSEVRYYPDLIRGETSQRPVINNVKLRYGLDRPVNGD